ncbi:MAG TPA: alpha/beta hydrolase [Pyrinomonadaceae bacterium]
MWLCAGFQSQSARSVSTGVNVNTEHRTQTLAVSPQQSTSSIEAQPRFASRFVTVDGTRLHYIVQGNSRPVVFIHGNPGSAQDWMAEFMPLTSRHKVIAFDRPGHGRSERPKHGEATVEVQAQLLHDALAQLRVERPILVGHSWGATLALVYAINYPNEVSGVVVVAPAAYESHDGSFLTGLPTVPVIGDAANYVLTPILGPSVVRGELKKAFSPDPVPKNYLKSVLSEWTKPSKVRAYAQDEDLYNSSVKKYSPRYAEIAVPVSIVTGDADLIVSEKENADRLHEVLPKSRLIVLPKTGHQIPFTHPQSVIDEIERVQRLSRARG